MSEPVFTSLTHGFSPDCRLANAQLRETLENYNFGAFSMEKTCSRCPNDDCNISFMLILQAREFMRLKRQVTFTIRPTFLVHRSFSELIAADHRIRKRLLADNSRGIQVGPEMANKFVDACPPVHNIKSQTDFMVCRRDAGGQTESMDRQDASCQVTRSPPVLEFSKVDSYSMTDINNNNKNRDSNNKNPSPSSGEVQLESDDDDEVVFIEIRQGAPRAVVQEVKQEPVEVPVLTLMRAREIKTEVFEPVLEQEAEEMEQEEPEEEQEQVPVKHEEIEEDQGEKEESSSSSTPSSSPQPTTSSSTIFSPLASAFSSLNTDAFYTPNNTSSTSTSGGSAAKRVKYSDIEICQRCLDVTYFEKLEEYVGHILESHVSISRFKCTACDKRFGSSIAAKHHTRCHEGQGDGPAEIVSDLSEDSVQKFLATANACYTDKFRSIQPEKIAEIIKNLP